jgi:asparagine synthase (glutamine-hydrolysing)
MCGITGILDFSCLQDMEGILRRMLGIIRHRGPDAFGIYTNNRVGLGSTRLSIIDLNGGDQPIHNEDRTVWVVFNGEIYNYPDIRQSLELKGHRFYTESDTEVLVHLYEDHGPEMLEALNGQFAFAIWDHCKEELLLARDRLGIRPLFYYQKGKRLVFGSEIKALFVDQSIPRQLDVCTLGDIFTCWTPLRHLTPFKDLQQVPPGHYALFSRKGLAVHPYWELTFEDSDRWERSISEWIEELRSLLYDAVRIRLRADVPVGAYLSGGLDSTYISTLIKTNFNNLLQTFSVNFTDGRYDEETYQTKAVESLGTSHRSVRSTEQDIGEIFPRVIWHTETPILRTAPAPLFQLSKLVRDNNFKVVLTGEGADEIFAGYNIFKEDRVRRFWARDLDSKLRPRLLEKLYPYVFSQGNGKSRAFLESFFKKGISEIDSPVYSHMLRWENTALLQSFFSDDLQEEMGGLNKFIERFVPFLPSSIRSWEPISRAQYIEASTFLPNYLLSSQGDRMAMGNSVEGRFPFLDHRVVQFACRIPTRLRLNGLREKYILKQVARDLIPSDLIERPKQPYRAPISQCFLGHSAPSYAEELLSESALKDTGYFNPRSVSGLLAKCHRHGGGLLSERENMALVGILSTQLVDQQFIRNFPYYPIHEPENIKTCKQGEG